MQKTAGVLAIFAAMALAVPSLSSGGKKDSWVHSEITPDGPAIFYSVSNAKRQQLWSVHCRQPLRDCVARAAGLVMRVDERKNIWLIAAVGPKTRVSIQHRNYTQNTPDLFASPLANDMISRLSGKDSFILIEENQSLLLRTRTEALDQVANYLAWIASPTGRSLRDARLWPRNGEIDTGKMTADVLERYEVMQRRQQEEQAQLVPSTKPQIEFAARAQGGGSYYSSTGDAGY